MDEVCFAEPFRFSRSSMRRFAEARNAQVRLAEEGSELAGFTIVHCERAEGELVGYLLTIDIAPAFRRRGLARQLLERAEADALATGCGEMRLHVFTGNAGAIALYTTLGYERPGLAEHFYSRGLHAWVYRKRLG